MASTPINKARRKGDRPADSMKCQLSCSNVDQLVTHSITDGRVPESSRSSTSPGLRFVFLVDILCCMTAFVAVHWRKIRGVEFFGGPSNLLRRCIICYTIAPHDGNLRMGGTVTASEMETGKDQSEMGMSSLIAGRKEKSLASCYLTEMSQSVLKWARKERGIPDIHFW